MTIYEKITVLRHNAGMSQDELAERLDVSRQSVSKWESGKALPDSAKILALSELFGVTTDFLLKDSEGFDTVRNDADDNISEDDRLRIAASADEDTGVIPVISNAEPEPPKKKNNFKKIIAVIAAVCVAIAAVVVPWKMGLWDSLFKKGNAEKDAEEIIEEPIDYPYVLVHGLGGWGPESEINKTVPYWGNSAGNLASIMTSQGSETYEASVGPFSSTWDRTCELYAQLTGTTVDYGEAHSKAHGHERYGREYTKPLFEGWGEKTKGGQIKKINLVGHSFGGETVRMLASLMQYGDEAERKSGGEISPLFKGGKGNWVNSVTTLCSPHNGSTLFYVVDSFRLVDTVLDIVYAAGGLNSKTPLNSFYDFRLEQFGITDTSDAKQVINKVFSEGTDNAAYDLSPDGAAELNGRIKTVNGIYYFSYSYSTTQQSRLLGTQIHTLKTNPVLWATADLMGSYSNNTVSSFQIDETWLENDGLVNVVSARYPFTDEWQEYDAQNIARGKWNVMPTRTGDHGTVIGLLADVQATKDFYNELYSMIDALPR